MTAISTQVERSLAQTVAATGRWKSARGHAAIMRRVLDLLDFMARGVFHVWRNHRYLTLTKRAHVRAGDRQGLPYFCPFLASAGKLSRVGNRMAERYWAGR